MRVFPKTGTGNLGAAFAAFVVFLFAAGHGWPDWIAVPVCLYCAANLAQALWRAAMRLCGERPDQKAAKARFEHDLALVFEFREYHDRKDD